ncbi:MAG: RNase adapter RapZ [Candidatus Limnocylindria bacterium]
MSAVYTPIAFEQEGTVARSAAAREQEGSMSADGSGSAANAPARPGTDAPGHFVVISGLSGAGKSQTSKLFEDLGYAVVDNLPPALLDDYLALREAEPDRYRRSALVLDIRAGDPAPAIAQARAALAADGNRLELIYLEANDVSLVSRFSETRHRHPLQETRSGVQASIADERRRLARTRELADHVVDTSGLSIGQLKERLFEIVPREAPGQELQIDIVTFGFKYGIPLEADLVFDVRFLTNPYWNPTLKPLSGLEEPVRDFVLGQESATRFLELVVELLELTAPAYRAEGKEHLHIALGCTGGYHRSIALAEELARRLDELPSASVAVFHRELER